MSADIVVPPCAVECTLALASLLLLLLLLLLPLLLLLLLLPRCPRPMMSYVPAKLPVDDDDDVSGYLEHRPPSAFVYRNVSVYPSRSSPCVTSLRRPARCVSTSCISMPCSIAHAHTSPIICISLFIFNFPLFPSASIHIIISSRIILSRTLDYRTFDLSLIMGGYRPLCLLCSALLGRYRAVVRYARICSPRVLFCEYIK